MKLNSIKFWIGCAITFTILFLMSYLGNDETDKLQRSLFVGLGGVIGLVLGTILYGKKGKDDQPPNQFD